MQNLVVLDARDVSTFTDFIVIMSGTSDRQVIRTCGHIEESLAKEKIFPIGIEGKSEGRWVLMDYGGVVIHIFQESVRLFYDLEGLWPEIPKTRYDERGRIIDSRPE